MLNGPKIYTLAAFAVKLLCTVGITIVPPQAVQMQSDNDFVIQVRQFRSS